MGHPAQWVLVLSRNELFEGHVLCTTLCMGVGGWIENWTECDSSPASFNRATVLAGVIHLDVCRVPLEHVRSGKG
jgi:hypothetical protein